MYDLATLETDLAGTLFAGQLHFSAQTGSTNSDALDAARQGAPHGSVYFTDEQLAGRGRGNHAWASAPGQGVYVSGLLRLPIPARQLPLLPLAAGLAAANAIRQTSGLTADLRWPNDLLIGHGKVGGILVEAKTKSDRVAYTVVGVGINVHQQAFDSDLAQQATSLDLQSGRRVSRQSLLASLLKSLESEMLLLCDPAAAVQFPPRVERASTWISGKAVQVHGPQACTGITDGLDANGFLRIRTDSDLVIVQTGGIRALP
jgi:BirA family biotin operon repressor/biotin-[acetyl-CoA-carboxylase] ligase